MLIIWTSSEEAPLQATFGEGLRAMRPGIPEHKIVPWRAGGEIPRVGSGDVLLASGMRTVEALREVGGIPKGRTLSNMREKVFPVGEGQGLITYDPGILYSDISKKAIMGWDLRLACRLHETGSTIPVTGNYRYVSDYTDVIARIEELYAQTKKSVDVALDLETMGFFPWYTDKEIITVQITVDPGTADVLYLGTHHKPPVPIDITGNLYEQMVFLLTSDRIKLRGANLKFDLLWIRVKWGIECTNFRLDTMLVGSLLDENRSNGLSTHAKVYTHMGGYDAAMDSKYDKAHMETVPPGEDLLTYAGGDTDACQQCADRMKTELVKDKALARFYITILHPAARAFEKIEYRGVLVDQEAFAVLRKDLSETIESGYARAVALLPPRMKIKFRRRIVEQYAEGKSPMLPSILKDYFFSARGLNLKPRVATPKTGEPSMAKSHLRMFEDVPEAMEMVEALTQADVASKTRSTFVDGFVKCIRPDGYIHPTYFLGHAEFEGFQGHDSGTNTGRLSAKGPAFQIIPKKTFWAKRIRQCYPAPEGKAVLVLDYSQGELRVVACVANEKNMIKSYEKNLDLHALTASQLGEVPYDEFCSWGISGDKNQIERYTDLRSRAKAGNFGLLYDISVAGFQAYAWGQYGFKLTEPEAKSIYTTFFKTYPGLHLYHQKQRDFAHLHGMVRSPLGRVARLPLIKSRDFKLRTKAERKAINSPIQSTLSDMMLWAIALIEDAYPNEEIAVVGMIHDALIAYVDSDKVALRARQANEIMSNLPFEQIGWQPQLGFPADAEGGPNLADLKKLKA